MSIALCKLILKCQLVKKYYRILNIISMEQMLYYKRKEMDNMKMIFTESELINKTS